MSTLSRVQNVCRRLPIFLKCSSLQSHTELQKPRKFHQNLTLLCFGHVPVIVCLGQACMKWIFVVGTHQFCLKLAQMGNTTSAIGVLESWRRIFLRKCWFILSRLYLCISFSVFEDLGLWPLWAIKVVTRQVWTFRQDIWRPIWEKFFLREAILQKITEFYEIIS